MNKAYTPKKVCAKIGLATFIMFASWFLLVNIIVIIFSYWAPEKNLSFSALMLINDLPLYLVGLPLFLCVLKTIPNGADPERQKLKMTVPRFLLFFIFAQGITYVASFISTYINQFLMNIIPGFDPYSNLEIIADANNNTLATLFFAVLVPAFGEEFIFRYCLHKKLRGASDKTYILISGLMFGFFHASFSQLLYATVIGIALAWLYTQTRNIFHCIGVHFGINLIGGVIAPRLVSNVDADALADVDALTEAALEGDVSFLSSGYLQLAFLGLLMFGLMAAAIIIFAVNFRKIRLSLRPPAEPGWPYKPPKQHYINRQRTLQSSGNTIANPYSGNAEQWKMPPPEDEVYMSPSFLPDYSNAMEEYRKIQETVKTEQEYNYFSGVPYNGPENTVEKYPVKNWFKTCILNYGMLLYFACISFIMAATLLIYMIFSL